MRLETDCAHANGTGVKSGPPIDEPRCESRGSSPFCSQKSLTGGGDGDGDSNSDNASFEMESQESKETFGAVTAGRTAMLGMSWHALACSGR
jgi:hypothetical protein